MSVDQCSNKYTEWLNKNQNGFPYQHLNTEVGTVNHDIMRDSFRAGWAAALNNSEEKQNDQPTQVKSSADATAEQIAALFNKINLSFEEGNYLAAESNVEKLRQLLLT